MRQELEAHCHEIKEAEMNKCPVVDDKGTVHHLFVVGKRTCLCGEKISPDLKFEVPSSEAPDCYPEPKDL
jgi:hypothetical protein